VESRVPDTGNFRGAQERTGEMKPAHWPGMTRINALGARIGDQGDQGETPWTSPAFWN
jgi:hypothetical protein